MSSPIDIDTTNFKICDTRCNFNFNYAVNVSGSISEKVINSSSKYISLIYPSTNLSEASFNSSKFNVTETRLYYPSIHTYSGSTGIAECIIVHTSVTTSQQLMVCIPITVGSSNTVASDKLKDIITSTTTYGSKITDFSLNKFIGNTPFYTYSGMAFDSSNMPTTYIVFNPSDYSIKLPSDTIAQLSNICGSNKYSIYTGQDKPTLFKNSKGPNKLAKNDIYIDCKPINKSGDEVVITNTKYIANTNFSLNKLKKNAILQFLLFFIVFIVFMYIIYYTFLLFGTIIKPSGNK